MTTVAANALGVMLHPRQTFARLSGTPGSVAGHIAGHLAILAAIPALALILRAAVVGRRVSFLGIERHSLAGSLTQGLVLLAGSLAAVYLAAVAMEAASPLFGVPKHLLGAVRAIGFAATPALLGGIFLVHPVLTWLVIPPAAYSAYLILLAVPAFLDAPGRKALWLSLVAWATLALVALALFLALPWGGGGVVTIPAP